MAALRHSTVAVALSDTGDHPHSLVSGRTWDCRLTDKSSWIEMLFATSVRGELGPGRRDSIGPYKVARASGYASRGTAAGTTDSKHGAYGGPSMEPTDRAGKQQLETPGRSPGKQEKQQENLGIFVGILCLGGG